MHKYTSELRADELGIDVIERNSCNCCYINFEPIDTVSPGPTGKMGSSCDQVDIIGIKLWSSCDHVDIIGINCPLDEDPIAELLLIHQNTWVVPGSIL
jgi:hypothetical protein